MNQITKSLIQLFIFTALGGLILYFLWQNLSGSYAQDCALKGIPASDCNLLDKLWNDFKSVNIIWIIVMCLTYMLSCVFRAVRWMMLFEPLGHKVSFKNSFWTVMIGYFTNLGLPRMGEFVRSGLFSKYEDIPYEKVLGTIVLGRIVDVFCLLFLIVAGLILHRQVMLEYFVQNFSLRLSDLMIIGLLGLGVFLCFLTFYRRMDTLSSPWIKKLKELLDGFIEGIVALKKVKNITLFSFYSIGIWILYVLMHWMGFLSFGPTKHLSISESVLAFDFAALGMVFPSPGGMGSYHAMLVEALGIFLIPPVEAFSIAMISYISINVFCNIVFGLIGLILLPIINSNRKAI